MYLIFLQNGMFCSIYQYHISIELIELSIHQKLQKYKIAILIYNLICAIYMNSVIHLKIKKSWHLLSKELKKSFTHNDKTINTVNCTAYYKLLHSK